MKRDCSGFTLLEVMVAVAIVGILAALALPTYRDYIERGRRAEGRELLARVAAAQERFYTNRNQYSADITGGAGLGLATALSENRYYLAEVEVAAGGQSYVLRSVPQGAQASDKCGALTVNNIGVRGYSGNENNGRCW